MKVEISKSYKQSVALDFNTFTFGSRINITFDIPKAQYEKLMPQYTEYVAKIARDSTFADIKKALPQLTLVAGTKPEPLSQLDRLKKGINL